MEPATYRDHLSSLFQSAAGDLVSGNQPGAPAPGTDNPLVKATSFIAGLWDNRQPVPAAAPAGIAQSAWQCAKQGWELLQAQAAGNAALVAQLQADDAFGDCDPGWAKVILDYAGLLASSGMRDIIPYIPPSASMQPLPMKPGATVALLGDWGTGTAAATQLLQQVAAHNPDVLIHLGDIYYSGTADECVNNFEAIVNRVFNREQNPITVFTLAGNHDMYSGGEGYYGLLQRLNPPPSVQPASFFCLRGTDDKWQFVAMDTGLHDDDPFNVDTVLTFLNPDEESWHAARIAEFPGKTILLSHHQLFSALAQIGPLNAEGLSEPVNPYLQTSYVRFAKAAQQQIAAWFWGHEHAFTIYDDETLPKGRCLGHGAIPALGLPAPVLPKLTYSPAYRNLALPMDPLNYYTHGFAIIQLGAAGGATADYYHQLAPGVPMFTETL
jgi:hypothetical protein